MRIDSRLIGFTAHRESSPFSKLALGDMFDPPFTRSG
jgi:hypothetical protein